MRRRADHAGLVVMLVTCPTRAVGRRIASHLVRAHLAACVNLLPGVESVFWWRGHTESAREVLLLIKTTRRNVSRVTQAVMSLHPYEVPEVIALPVITGHAPYLRWVRASLLPRHPSR